jgi:hypothetical protein
VGLQFWTKNLLQIGDSTFMRINLYTSIYGKFFSIKNLKWQNGKMAKWQNGKSISNKIPLMTKWQNNKMAKVFPNSIPEMAKWQNSKMAKVFLN